MNTRFDEYIDFLYQIGFQLEILDGEKKSNKHTLHKLSKNI